jgi:hypothetical protein
VSINCTERTRRRLVVADSVDDYAIALAIAIADEALERWAPALRFGREPSGVSLHREVIFNRLFSRERWRTFQELWYRWRSPRDYVSPMQWYLAALDGRIHGDARAISAAVDGWMQEHSAREIGERAEHIRTLIGAGREARVIAACGEPACALPAIAGAAVSELPFVWCERADELDQLTAHAHVWAIVGGPGFGNDTDNAGAVNDELPRLSHLALELGAPLAAFAAEPVRQGPA